MRDETLVFLLEEQAQDGATIPESNIYANKYLNDCMQISDVMYSLYRHG